MGKRHPPQPRRSELVIGKSHLMIDGVEQDVTVTPGTTCSPRSSSATGHFPFNPRALKTVMFDAQ